MFQVSKTPWNLAGNQYTEAETKWLPIHFTDAILKFICLNENVWILIKISLEFVPQGPIYNIPALVQMMTLSVAIDGVVWLRINASLGLNELSRSAETPAKFQIQVLY